MKLNNEMLLLISIFRQAAPFDTVPNSPAGYVDCLYEGIEQRGRLLRLLGLAEKNSKAALGWKPTSRLIMILGKRVVEASRSFSRRSKPVTDQDREFVSKILRLVANDDDEQVSEFCCRVFAAIGLFQACENGWKPTSLLHILVLEKSLTMLK
jgi:hypothetical protein